VVGPLISRLQRDRVEAFIRRGREEGAELVAGGKPVDRPGWYVAPCLMLGRNDGYAAREEAFGPVVVAMSFDDEDEAVALANGSEYGLFGYVYTKDTARGMRVAQRLRTGCVGVNTLQPHHEAPFGGFKMSGVGRDRGVFGLHAYAELQSITWPG
jgi:acyl-CoA reductase-like NAD-dependent aldehyde dehydrogenase